MQLDKDEHLIVSVKRHKMSAIYIVVVATIIITMLLAALFFGVKYSADLGIADYKAIYTIALGFLLVLAMMFTWAALYLNRKNELIITNENIIQVLQFGLFNKQVSQLNMAKIQDVSVDQNGPIATFLNFGVLEIETAGEAANFRFSYTPDPNVIAKIIIEAHEDYVNRETGAGGAAHI